MAFMAMTCVINQSFSTPFLSRLAARLSEIMAG